MKLDNRLKRVVSCDEATLRVTLEFTDGFRGTVDLTQLFRGAARPLPLEILRGRLFERCFIEGGALAWANGYELCPDALRARIVEPQRRRPAA